jgi:septal ring-binding cell division protein DamX
VSTAAARSLPAGAGASRRPALQLVAGRLAGRSARRRRLPFAVLLGVTLLGGLVGLLLLHTLAAQDAFRLEALQARQAALADSEQQLAVVEQRLESPAALAARARALGMVPTQTITSVHRGRHGRLIGVAPAVAAATPVHQTPARHPPVAASGPKATRAAPAASKAAAARKPARRAAHHRHG